MNTLLVVGSANADHVLTFDTLPKAGETLLSEQYRLELGGKGANQAVAATRLKSASQQVEFICALGDDGTADTMCNAWSQDGMQLSGSYTIDGQSSGTAMIFVSQQGENCIGVVPGANACLRAEHIQQQTPLFAKANYLLIQLETPIATVHAALTLAKQHHCCTILNPAPAAQVSTELLSMVDIITPNETEAYALTGVEVVDEDSAAQAAAKLHQWGIKCVVITLGRKGAYLSVNTANEIDSGIIAAQKVAAVDTVAAGDTFNGALMVGLDSGLNYRDAISFANQASAIAVTRYGAQRSIPFRAELS